MGGGWVARRAGGSHWGCIGGSGRTHLLSLSSDALTAAAHGGRQRAAGSPSSTGAGVAAAASSIQNVDRSVHAAQNRLLSRAIAVGRGEAGEVTPGRRRRRRQKC